jgi:hypothetical protein
MPWSPLPDAPKEVERGFRGKARILVDESLGSEVAKFLREQGCNAVYASRCQRYRGTRRLWEADQRILADTAVHYALED